MSEFNSKQELYCKFCNKLCYSKNSLVNHERLCKLNPSRKLPKSCLPGHVGYNKGKPSWNKGLTKETDSRVAKGANNLKLYRQYNKDSSSGKGATPEKEALRKQKISTYAKSRNFGGLTPRSGRGKKGWYKGFFCDSTYELVFVIYNLDNNIPFKRCERIYEYLYQDKIHKYYPDFELQDGSLIEIKGYHTDLVDIKLSSVNDRSIKVLYKQDLEYAFDWVKDHYTYKCLYDLYEK